MNERQLLIAGALNMFIAVAAGAFGAHGLRRIVEPDLLTVWQTGVLYHLIHGLALLIIGLLVPRLGSSGAGTAGLLMLVGIVLFCGSLYVLTLTGIRILGAVTPFGGAAFLAGWGWLIVAAWRMAGR